MNGERKQKDSRLFGGAAKFGSKMYLLALFGLLVLSLLWFAPQKAYSATAGNGPGGVGTTNGGSSLKLWLRADRGVFSQSNCTIPAANGNSVGCWQDQSGNGAHAKQQGAIGVPTFDSSPTPLLNGNPVLNFTGSQLLESPSVTLSDLSVFVVFNASNDGMVYEHNNRGVESFGSNLFTGRSCAITVNRNGTETNKSGNSASWGAGNISRIVTQAYNGTHLGHTLSINNSPQGLGDCNSNGDPLSDPLLRGVYIGARANLTCCGLNGNIAEMIFFSENLPAVQKILVENYLSAKYGIGLDSNDYYDGDTPPNGDFDLDVAGIGQLGGVQNTEAHAAGMIVRDVDFLQDGGDWLLFGHNTPQNLNTTNDIPTVGDWDGTNDQRWARHFYVDVTDDTTLVGCSTPGTCSVDIVFDFSDGGMTGNPGGTATNYRLLSRPNPSGQFSDITASCVTSGTAGVSIAGDQVTFDGVDVTCLGSNFTLGTIDVVNSPTAVSLQPIVATPQTNGLFIFAACVLALGLGSLWACLRHRPE
ncbi:MAG: hypothetical protein KBE23_00540 [Chloroflexi bacterium]|nr:hypothetical protein [Chloroflexota bacterium]MBP7041201.1 hypothetical protein [Chloroflexota bacterium]